MNKKEFIEKIKQHGAWCTECHDINGEKDIYVKSAKVRELIDQLDEPQADKVEAHLAEHWDENIGDVLWWNFPVEEPLYYGTPLDERFPKYKTHFTTIKMPNEIEQPKRWVVRAGDYHSTYVDSLTITSGKLRHTISGKEKAHYFTDRTQAEAVALLVDGSVEEV